MFVFFDRLFLGFANGLCRKDLDYVIDSSLKTRVHDTPLIASELEAIVTQGLPRARKEELTRALEFVATARAIFQKARPKLIDGQRHYVVVRLPDLLAVVRRPGAIVRLGLTDADVELLCSRLNRLPGHRAAAPATARHSLQYQMDERGATRILQVASVQEGEDETEYRKCLREEHHRRSSLRADGDQPVPASVKPEDTTVCFSLFVQALQPIYRRICAAENITTSTSYQQTMYRPPSNSAYLN
jgi:hypothetical protein